ncbi:phenylalanine--tRNA ligase subunit beta [Mangrovicoccus algicola]|uniref:Phenylalanine--tRNA ligase beta subunit n=1 Tax=Mangrovicoccus algicola TaxID=2771008 RepID=A0A8J6Z3J0_9RHOB|nr:phenylalanine--tRNA ligase subunit beta [Mangrovicoccus algicola]MBE3636804.1 phenylalanine--tRNA ligase subunit beta [Mangrovicoccus algicola]
MKFTLSWLKEHLDTAASLDEIAYALTDLGLEVEEISNPAEKLAGFALGKVVAAEKHPDADKLRVCQVETAGGPTQIVCGAPNAREGITVVVASPGTYVPGIDITIQKGVIRGQESFGMMCSMRELELGEDHDGIIELPSGEVGQSFPDWLAAHDPAKVDPVIEIAITPNRPDALGVRGIARDLAARGLGTLKTAAPRPVEAAFPCPVSVSIDADTAGQAPVFYGRMIRGVKNGPSPEWLQQRLKAIGLRPISFLVDVTNYFTFDACRPLHVFDADKITGASLRVHRAEGGETLTGLDEKTYTFQPGMTVISDAEGPESIGGVMGGLRTGCTGETVNVFVEAAYFDPVRTALTGRALKINSDARYRFERGIDPLWTPSGLDEATAMILEIAGGEASEVVMAGALPDVARSYKLDVARVQSLVGMEIAPETQRATLTALGFALDADDMAAVPSWRPDILGEADLVEEVARVASLTKLQGRPMARARAGVPKPILTPQQRREQAARRMLASLGYNECVTYSFVDGKSAERFGGGDAARALENPISADLGHMRPDLLPGLLMAAARNQARGFADLALFEVGPAFSGGEPEEQSTHVTGLLVGQSGPRDPHGARRALDVYDAKADMEAVLSAIGAPEKAQIFRDTPDWFHPGRSGRVGLGPKKTIALFGELHPRVLEQFGLKGPALAFTVLPAEVPLPKKSVTTRPALVLNDLQAVDRDFAFVVDASVEAASLVNAAAGADKALIQSVRVFDEFTGAKAEAQMGEGRKSLALTVRLQPVDRTLTEKDIEAVSDKIVEKVAKATGAVLRG